MRSGDDRLRALAASPEVMAHLRDPANAVFIVRRDGHIVWASPSVQTLFGHRLEDILDRNGWNLFVAKEDIAHIAEYSALLSEGDVTAWLPVVRADRSKAWFRLQALEREGGVVAVFRREADPAEHRFHSLVRPRPR